MGCRPAPAIDPLKQRILSRKAAFVHTGRCRVGLFDELKESLWGERGDSYAEIARRQDSTEGAIKVAAHRLRQRIRDQLRGEVAGN